MARVPHIILDTVPEQQKHRPGLELLARTCKHGVKDNVEVFVGVNHQTKGSSSNILDESHEQ